MGSAGCDAGLKGGGEVGKGCGGRGGGGEVGGGEERERWVVEGGRRGCWSCRKKSKREDVEVSSLVSI